MPKPLRTALLLALVTALAPPPVRAQAPAPSDSSQLVVFEHDQPVAHERNYYTNMGDSIVVEAETTRQFTDDKGQRHPFRKTMVLAVDSHDLGLIRYFSNQEFDGHRINRGVLAGDTSMTYYIELDGGGNADRVVQPPGRLFVMDSQMFSLFDVLCRSVVNKTFETRRVQVIALTTDSLAAPLATLASAGFDTLRLGKATVRAHHYTFEDPSARFDLWADPKGRLVRLTHAESGLRVERAPDEAPRPATAAKKPAAKPANSAGKPANPAGKPPAKPPSSAH